MFEFIVELALVISIAIEDGELSWSVYDWAEEWGIVCVHHVGEDEPRITWAL